MYIFIVQKYSLLSFIAFNWMIQLWMRSLLNRLNENKAILTVFFNLKYARLLCFMPNRILVNVCGPHSHSISLSLSATKRTTQFLGFYISTKNTQSIWHSTYTCVVQSNISYIQTTSRMSQQQQHQWFNESESPKNMPEIMTDDIVKFEIFMPNKYVSLLFASSEFDSVLCVHVGLSSPIHFIVIADHKRCKSMRVRHYC